MKFSAQEEYGLRCLLAIAVGGEGTSKTIPEIAEVEGLTAPHVAKLLAILKKSGFLTATRGQSGGYALSREPRMMVVGEILAALGGKLFEDGFCERHSGIQSACAHTVDCSVRDLWTKIQVAVDSVVSQITLQDVLDRKLGVEPELMSLQPISNRPGRAADCEVVK